VSSQQTTVDQVMEPIETLSTLEHDPTSDEYAEKHSLLGLWQRTRITQADTNEARKEIVGNFRR
jgi:hypothetical protein